MTLNEFNQKDLELETQINQYRLASNKLQTEILLNERAITELQQKRSVLRHEYAQESN